MSSTLTAMAAKKPRLNLEEIEKWHERIVAAEETLEESVMAGWKSTFETFTGESADQGVSFNDDTPNFNFLLATANVLIPSIISASPYLRFQPRRPGDEHGAKIAESAVNYVFREIGIKGIIEDGVLDTLLYGIV